MRFRCMSASTTPMSTPRLPVLLPSNKAKKHVGEGRDDFSSRFQSASNWSKMIPSFITFFASFDSFISCTDLITPSLAASSYDFLIHSFPSSHSDPGNMDSTVTLSGLVPMSAQFSEPWTWWSWSRLTLDLILLTLLWWKTLSLTFS